MTPPIRMVSVPVDELAQEIRRVDGNHSLGAGALAEALLPFLSRFTAAPVREEGGAVWFGVTGAADETEALAVALFDARCPGVRMTDEDLHYYRAAAQRAMRAVEDELETPALATREDAQPVGWLRAVDEEMVCAHLGVADAEDSFETAKKKLASLIQWNIAVATDPSVGGHPAPDALRASLADLIENAVAARGCGLKNDPDGIVSSALFDTIMNARQALATLQVEQGAK